MNLKTAWLKTYLRYPIDIRRANEYLAGADDVPDWGPRARTIVVDIHTPQLLFDCGRHLNCIAQHAAAAGSPFVLRCSKLLLAAVARKLYGPELLSNANVQWIEEFSDCPSDAFVLTDAPERTESLAAVAMMIGSDSPAGSMVMPYPMHHRTLQQLPTTNLRKLRSLGQPEGRSGLFFAGRLKDNYQKSQIDSRFGVVNRLDVIGTLRHQFPERILSHPVGSDANEQLTLAGNPQSITLVDSAQVAIDASDWLPTLARYDLFVCSPGVCQPMCHNVIEAMSVGTIPLIEYGDRFSPALTDSVNAVRFRGTDGLAAAVRRIDAMTPNQISELRRGVAEYYDRHLCGDAFLANLRDLPAGQRPETLSMPFHDVNLFRHDTLADDRVGKQTAAA